MPKARKSHYTVRIPKMNPVAILFLVFLFLIVSLYSRNRIESIKTGQKIEVTVELTSTQAPTQNIINNDSQPATNNINNSSENTLTLEERQKLGQQKAKLEEAIRQTKAEEERLRKKTEEAKIDCESYTETKDQCLSDVKELEYKLEEMIKQNDIDAFPLKAKISEINALLSSQ